MTTMAQMLMEKRKQAEAQLRALLDRAETEHRELTAEEDQQFERLSGEMNSLRSQSDKLVKFHADHQASEESLRSIGHRGPMGENDWGGDEGLGSRFRALAEGQGRGFDMQFSQQEARYLTQHRALSKGTGAAGGNVVPTTFMGQLLEHLIESATLLRGGATIFNTSGGENMDFPITLTHGTAALVAEAGVIPQSDPAFGKRTLGAYKYGDLILVPSELLTDTAVDLEGYLARMAGRAVGNALGQHLIAGTGTGQPTGLFASTTLGVTSPTGTSGAPTFDTLIDLYYSVSAPYRLGASWLIKDTTAGALRKLKDSSGRYLWEASLTAGVPDTILGRPVLTDPYVAATGLNAKSIAFGDLSRYAVRLVNNIRFERSDDFKFDTDVVAFRCLLRGDGLLLDQSGSVKHLLGAAT